MLKKFKLDFISRPVFGSLIVVLIAGTLLFAEKYYENQNTKAIISRTKVYINNALNKLVLAFYKRYELKNFNQNYITSNSSNEVELIDSVFKEISSNELSYYTGVEGGFYLSESRKFVGFAFPTSPPPQPSYGPPPREYNIVLNQIEESLNRHEQITKVYQFEPTVFLLATKHLKIENKIVGAAYAIIRVEQILPFSFYKKFFPIVLFLSFSGIGLAIYISWLLRKRVEEIKNGLELIKKNQSLRLHHQKGVLGVISKSINNLLDARDEEQRERIRLEKELQMKERMAALGNLIAAVTHQIKTPLAIIKSKIQLWQRKIENISDENANGIITKESMSEIVSEIDRLSGLVNKLLLFLKNPVEDFIESDINETVDKVLGLLKSELDSNKIKVRFDRQKLPLVRINPSSFEQVIVNILVNAIHAIQNDGEIVIHTFQISENQIAIEIKDNGIGIPSEIIDKIFDPFFTTKKEGYGLGLSIAYEIIKLHKGSINVFQNEPRGTIFRIILPIN
ncbi:ATP-binding protein [Ignavibacterium sp.]|uniref:sensor histidine kinase n=1 Tax=Ignavibacterium sp. TaxID=2651167 RepID=UPI00220E1C15|nr:ATP-binding protein [Ignavibacterium sp.]BDQ02226.1 MAG: hypothetical protein KatS3mg037_0801 [Ignavibacterium sp.]